MFWYQKYKKNRALSNLENLVKPHYRPQGAELSEE